MNDLLGAAPHDAGGKRSIRLPPGVSGTAIWGGPGDCYRYRVRYWQKGAAALTGSSLAVIMMNPSTASHFAFDPTLAKCWRFARHIGACEMAIGNSYAYRATDQRRLVEVDDPIGPANDEMLLEMARSADLVVLAYGTPQIARLRDRGPAVARMLRRDGVKLHVFGLSKHGVPKHPLYLKEPLMLEWF